MVEDIHLNNINLRGGSWAGALGMLRDRVQKKGQDIRHGNCCKLTGGEFGKGNESDQKFSVSKSYSML